MFARICHLCTKKMMSIAASVARLESWAFPKRHVWAESGQFGGQVGVKPHCVFPVRLIQCGPEQRHRNLITSSFLVSSFICQCMFLLKDPIIRRCSRSKLVFLYLLIWQPLFTCIKFSTAWDLIKLWWSLVGSIHSAVFVRRFTMEQQLCTRKTAQMFRLVLHWYHGQRVFLCECTVIVGQSFSVSCAEQLMSHQLMIFCDSFNPPTAIARRKFCTGYNVSPFVCSAVSWPASNINFFFFSPSTFYHIQNWFRRHSFPLQQLNFSQINLLPLSVAELSSQRRLFTILQK